MSLVCIWFLESAVHFIFLKHYPSKIIQSLSSFMSWLLQGRKYELVSTITHHGKEASKGHYTADARYPRGQWLRFDDASVTAISSSKVLHDQAYVLFYQQCWKVLPTGPFFHNLICRRKNTHFIIHHKPETVLASSFKWAAL